MNRPVRHRTSGEKSANTLASFPLQHPSLRPLSMVAGSKNTQICSDSKPEEQQTLQHLTNWNWSPSTTSTIVKVLLISFISKVWLRQCFFFFFFCQQHMRSVRPGPQTNLRLPSTSAPHQTRVNFPLTGLSACFPLTQITLIPLSLLPSFPPPSLAVSLTLSKSLVNKLNCNCR